MGKKKVKISNQLKEKLIYALIGLAIFLCGVGLLLIFMFKAQELGTNGIIDKVYYILLIPFAIAAAIFLFKLMPSSATFKGKVLGGILKLGGPIVLFCLILVGGFYLVPDTSPFDFTIFLKDAHGKTVLKNNGKIILRLDSDTRSNFIDHNGSATYKRIPQEFKNTKNPIEIEAEGWRFLNHRVSTTVELKGNNAQLEIERDESLAIISGYIRDMNGDFIKGATVIVLDRDTLTDGNGWFSLKISPGKQQKRQTLYVRKEAYRNWSGFVYPGENQEIQIRLEEESI